MTLAEYAALLQLAEAPGRRLRMNQLADGIFLSRSGVTRLIDRLEADGLVERSQCSSDGRGAEAVLTDAGLARLRQASRTHLRGIEAYFLDSVDADRPRGDRALVRGGRRAGPRRRTRPAAAGDSPDATPAPGASPRLIQPAIGSIRTAAPGARPRPGRGGRRRARGHWRAAAAPASRSASTNDAAAERRDGQPGQERVAAPDRIAAADGRRARRGTPRRPVRARPPRRAPRVTTTAPPVRAAIARAGAAAVAGLVRDRRSAERRRGLGRVELDEPRPRRERRPERPRRRRRARPGRRPRAAPPRSSARPSAGAPGGRLPEIVDQADVADRELRRGGPRRARPRPPASTVGPASLSSVSVPSEASWIARQVRVSPSVQANRPRDPLGGQRLGHPAPGVTGEQGDRADLRARARPPPGRRSAPCRRRRGSRPGAG